MPRFVFLLSQLIRDMHMICILCNFIKLKGRILIKNGVNSAKKPLQTATRASDFQETFHLISVKLWGFTDMFVLIYCILVSS